MNYLGFREAFYKFKVFSLTDIKKSSQSLTPVGWWNGSKKDTLKKSLIGGICLRMYRWKTIFFIGRPIAYIRLPIFLWKPLCLTTALSQKRYILPPQ